ncbi:glycoprotein precursor [Pacui virus]|uniref:Envelopment polyprotein n=1 Tax=Pacui virus TaxID=1538454 RepID=A0A088NFD7_9VIRU|nr:glycoprotein precursor [Pacui virus]AIN55742.1 glycoprotein precursor [Pacui virus]
MKGFATFVALFSVTVLGSVLKSDSNYCFQGGRLSIKKENVRLGHRQCIRDDVSLIKQTYVKTKNDSNGPLYEMHIYRKDTVKNWHACNPKAVEEGPLQLLEYDQELNFHFGHYACTKHCDIKIDKEYARIELTSSGLNYYEVLGTINQRNWLMSKIHIDLSHTCENLIVTCGMDSVKFHACFKQHMECNRFFKNSWVPSIIVNGFCSNIEFFLFFVFLFVTFSLLWLLAKTILCYFLMPIYFPIVYAYSKIYMKVFKRCKSCGLAIHPLKSCGVECICGMVFESTEKLKRHRDSAIGCKGYKTGIAARKACRSKISNFGLALFMAIFLFFFLTPAVAVQIPINDGRVLDAENIGDSIVNLYEIVEKVTTVQLYFQFAAIIILVLSVFLVTLKYILERRTVMNTRRCRACKMYHMNLGLCTRQCICGYVEKGEEQMIMLENLKTIVHTPNNRCFLKSFRKQSRAIDFISVIVMLVAITTVSIGAAAEDCSSLGKEKKYVCECITAQDKDIVDLAQKCLAISVSIDCGDAPNMIDAIKAVTDSDEAKKHIDDLVKLERGQLVQMQSEANTTGWFYTFEILSAIVDCPTEVQRTAYLAELEINLNVRTIYPCQETQKTAYKKQCECMKGLTCEDNNIQAAYDDKPDEFQKDLRALTDRAHRLVPGGYQKMVFLAFKLKKEDLLKFILEKLKSGFLSGSKTSVGYIKVLTKSFKTDLVKTTDAPMSYKKMIRPNNVSVQVHVPMSQVQNMVHTESIRICPSSTDWYIVSCIGVTEKDNLNLLVCKNKANKIDVGSLYEVSGNLCYKDQTCDVEMAPLTKVDTGRFKRFTCSKLSREKSKLVYIHNKPMIKVCEFKNQGMCKVRTAGHEVGRSVVQCGKDIIHADIKHMVQKPDEDHGMYCFDQKCESARAFIHESRISGCKLAKDLQLQQKDVTVSLHKNLDEYLESIKTNLMQGLKVDKYVPTAGLPKHVPVYKHLTLQGSETAEGISSSFVKFSMAAITGSSGGFHINTPDGKILFDIVVYILNSEISSLYDFSYITGQTRSLKTFHDEQCTSSCPKTIPNKPAEAISFFKERTSNWGCEEWGCMAINTGCLFGWCQDVISNDARVYQKSNEGTIKIKLCISLPTDTFCHDIDGTEPAIGETISAQLSTVEVEHFKTPVLIRDGSVFYGQINNKGSFAPICGSVQKIKKRTFGSGNPQVDYTCHAAQRKDVIIRKCFDNWYKSCKLLTPYDVIIGRKTNETITLKKNNINLGNLEVKIMLGDITFKQFAENVEIHYKAKCVGCIDCIDGISCNIEIHMDRDVSCPIKSEDCNLFYSQLMIMSGKSDYDIKMKCQNKIDSIELSICGTSQKVPLEVVQHKDKIEIDNNDSPTYIREEDLRCSTWLCKVYNEGIGGFTGLLKLITGEFYYWILGVGIAFLALIFIIYLLMPVIKKLLTNVKELKAIDDRRDEIIRKRLLEQKKKG